MNENGKINGKNNKKKILKKILLYCVKHYVDCDNIMILIINEIISVW